MKLFVFKICLIIGLVTMPLMTLGQSYPVIDGAPFGWQYFKWAHRIIMAHKFMARKQVQYLLFIGHYGKEGEKEVTDVLIVPEKDELGIRKYPSIYPPQVMYLIYHNIGKDKEFCGAYMEERIYRKDGSMSGTMWHEMRLDDDTAQIIIDLITGYSNFTDKVDKHRHIEENFFGFPYDKFEIVETKSEMLSKIKFEELKVDE